MERKNVWESYSTKQIRECDLFNKEYRDFLDNAKTEREAVNVIVNLAEKSGYVEFEEAVKKKKGLKKGDKVYSVVMNKSIVLFNIGEEPLEKGMNILGAHIDSPRIDIKSYPVYENGGFAFLDTHYYGGIKKYQWVAQPLSLHGVVIKKDGTTIELSVGEDEDDPVFFVSDLLIHLSQEQLEKKAAKVIEGEALDIIIGNKPLAKEEKASKKNSKESKEDKDEKDAVKKSVLDILKKYYDIEEEDFLSAELEIVPAGKAREAGFDRSMVLGYGQDDRVCAFPSYKAMFKVKKVKRTAVCILTDKEEIGSVGATGMQSQLFENVMAELLNLCEDYSEIKLKRMLANSNMLSSDVSSAFDPSYASSFDKKNVAYLGKGLVLCK
ncbi:MAG: aminopeptidase, partial [Lachnospiraceae bacterium]|nr:aminopeptidase [Lachnospiraceae bacterium]